MTFVIESELASIQCSLHLCSHLLRSLIATQRNTTTTYSRTIVQRHPFIRNHSLKFHGSRVEQGMVCQPVCRKSVIQISVAITASNELRSKPCYAKIAIFHKFYCTSLWKDLIHRSRNHINLPSDKRESSSTSSTAAAFSCPEHLSSSGVIWERKSHVQKSRMCLLYTTLHKKEISVPRRLVKTRAPKYFISNAVVVKLQVLWWFHARFAKSKTFLPWQKHCEEFTPFPPVITNSNGCEARHQIHFTRTLHRKNQQMTPL